MVRGDEEWVLKEDLENLRVKMNWNCNITDVLKFLVIQVWDGEDWS